MARGAEGLFLAHWLSNEKLNLCILCAKAEKYLHDAFAGSYFNLFTLQNCQRFKFLDSYVFFFAL